MSAVLGVVSGDKAVAATRQAQSAMRAFYPRLVVDGHWGSFTDSVYASLPMMQKSAVDLMLSAYGPAYTAGNLRQFFAAQKAAIPKGGSAALTEGWITPEKARALVERAYGVLNASSAGIKLSDLQITIWFEAARKRVDGVTYFNPAAVNSLGYTGLYQFARKTWNDVASRFKTAALPSFDEGAKQAWANTLAFVAYAMLNAKSLRGLGYKGNIDARVIYGSHQQGAAGMLHYLRTGNIKFPGQSKESLAFIRDGKLPGYAVV